MLLQRLVEYQQREEDADAVPIGYNAEPVRYWFELDGDGNLLGIVTAENADGKRPKKVAMPTLVRASGVKAKLLADNAAYVLGMQRESDTKPERVTQMHAAFVDLVHRCARDTGEPAVEAVERFVTNVDPSRLTLPDDFDPAQTIAFEVDGIRPTDLPAVQGFWQRAGAEGTVMQCLVCGRDLPAMERIQLKLKGIPGGTSTGLALLSANSDAFLSYGLEASLTSPTCQECSDRFMKAANTLVAGESTHLRVGEAVYIFWTRQLHTTGFATFLAIPDPNDVRALLQSVFRGGSTDADPDAFYATAISASVARAVVRDWIETTVGQARANLARFFARQEIVDWDGGPARFRGVFALGRATQRTGTRDDVPAWVVQALVHSALSGGPVPWTLLFRAVERCRAEQGVSPGRAQLIKMVLASHNPSREKGQEMTELDLDNRAPAYLCGRLFAELEAVQYAALGSVGANIVDRYYGTASSAPATVFGRLVRGAQSHLGKLRHTRPAAYHAIDRRLQEITRDLPSFPLTLTLQQQGLFALGYYHQRAADQLARTQRGGRTTPGEQDGHDLQMDEEE